MERAIPASHAWCKGQSKPNCAKSQTPRNGNRKDKTPMLRLARRFARNDTGSISAPARNVNTPLPSMAILTDREREVVALVAQGLTNEEIATELVLSPATARTHVSRAMIKLGTRDRAQLVVLAYESGLVRPGWLG